MSGFPRSPGSEPMTLAEPRGKTITSPACNAGRTVALRRPQLIHDEHRRLMPAPVRLILGVGNISDFLELVEDDAQVA